jgi:hypothetical protein
MILALTQLWLNRTDSGAAITAVTTDRGPAYSTAREVVTFASGRQRAISVVGERGTVPFTLMGVSYTTVVTLRQWMRDGVTVQARDHRGQRWFGVFDEIRQSEPLSPNEYDVGIVLRTVDVVEGV